MKTRQLGAKMQVELFEENWQPSSITDTATYNVVLLLFTFNFPERRPLAKYDTEQDVVQWKVFYTFQIGST
jgi:hypothetical protein